MLHSVSFSNYFSPFLSVLFFRSNREIAFQQLQTTLAKKDFELAKLQQNQSNLVSEISELRRHTKREGVNLDYLKNIVLQVRPNLVFFHCFSQNPDVAYCLILLYQSFNYAAPIHCSPFRSFSFSRNFLSFFFLLNSISLQFYRIPVYDFSSSVS